MRRNFKKSSNRNQGERKESCFLFDFRFSFSSIPFQSPFHKLKATAARARVEKAKIQALGETIVAGEEEAGGGKT